MKRETDVVRIPLAELAVDPERFQFKLDVDANGASSELKDVTRWEPDAEGVVSVWREGEQVWVVNGHCRFELAKRLGRRDLRCRNLDAKTAVEARTRGALINIREGRGTAIDAAKVFRDAKLVPADLDRLGISMGRGTVARDGLALAALDPSLFYKVVIGQLSVARGALIGRELPEHAEQHGLVQMLAEHDRRGKSLNDSEVYELIRHARAAGTVTMTQTTLFGPETITNSLAIPKARVSSYVRSRLEAEKRTFGFVSTGHRAKLLARGGNVIVADENRERAVAAAQLLELYDKLSVYVGPVSDGLKDFARQLAEGKKAEDVIMREAFAALLPILMETLGTLTPPTVKVHGSSFTVEAA